MSLVILGCNKDAVEEIYLNPDAGASFLDIENEGYKVSLGAIPVDDDQIGTWKIYLGEFGRFDNVNDPNTTFYGEPGEVYQLGWEVSQGKEYKADVISVTFKPLNPVVKTIAQDTIHNNISLYLKAAPAKFGAVGTWSITNGENARIENPNNENAEFVGVEFSDYTIRWTLSYGSKAVSEEFSFTTDEFNAFAGIDNLDIITERDAEKFYNLDAFLPAGAVGEWSIIGGEEASIYNNDNAKSLFKGNPDERYALRWKVNLDGRESIDTLNIRFRGKWGVWVDERDNQEYKYAEFDGLEWMAENYNYAAEPGYGSWYYGNAERSIVKDGIPVETKENRKKYGRLYYWRTAMDYAPEGWRLPTYDELIDLVNKLGGDFYAGEKIQKGGETGIDLDYAGYLNMYYGNDPAFRNAFLEQDVTGAYWTSTYYENTGKTSALIVGNYTDAMRMIHVNGYAVGFSVRYVREIQQ